MQFHPSSRAAVLIAVTCLAFSACKKEPTPAELKLAKGNELFRAQDYAGAAAVLVESLTLDPAQDQAIWDKAAFCYKKAAKLELAGDTLVKAAATRTKPEEKLANLRNAAGMYLEGNLPEKAEPTFKEALKLDPKDTDSLAWLAEISSQRGGARKNDGVIKFEDLENALALYEQLVTITPAAAGNYVNKRIVLGRLVGAYNQQAANATDPETKAKASARAELLKANLDETSKKLSEVMKAAKGTK